MLSFRGLDIATQVTGNKRGYIKESCQSRTKPPNALE